MWLCLDAIAYCGTATATVAKAAAATIAVIARVILWFIISKRGGTGIIVFLITKYTPTVY